MKNYILYNTEAGNGDCRDNIGVLEFLYEDPEYIDVKKIVDYPLFISGLQQDDNLIICGGDGTLNRFVNNVGDNKINCKVYYYPIGTGNDFAKDLGKDAFENPFPVTKHLKDLPSVEVKGKRYRFINGVGFGLDGYCCEEGDRLKAIPGKKVNYTAIAIKGLLFAFKPVNATVVVDGEEYSFRKVWIAPTMKGRFYGGGIMPTPNQERGKADGSVSMMLFHGSGKLRTLMIFPTIFKGEHLKYTKNILILSGRDIQVTFDRPCPLQVDGETIVDVTSYHVIAGKQ